MHTSPMRTARLWRIIVPGRDSVARPSDRVQGMLLVLAILTALAASVFAVLLGTGIYLSESTRSRDEAGTRYPVTATLLADGPSIVFGAGTDALADSGPTDATWVLRDGTRRFGPVDAHAGMVTSNPVPIWVDQTGTAVAPPLSATAAVVDSVVIGIGVGAGAVFLLALLYRSAVFVLDRFRLARWQQEWFHVQERQAHP